MDQYDLSEDDFLSQFSLPDVPQSRSPQRRELCLTDPSRLAKVVEDELQQFDASKLVDSQVQPFQQGTLVQGQPPSQIAQTQSSPQISQVQYQQYEMYDHEDEFLSQFPDILQSSSPQLRELCLTDPSRLTEVVEEEPQQFDASKLVDSRFQPFQQATQVQGQPLSQPTVEDTGNQTENVEVPAAKQMVTNCNNTQEPRIPVLVVDSPILFNGPHDLQNFNAPVTLNQSSSHIIPSSYSSQAYVNVSNTHNVPNNTIAQLSQNDRYPQATQSSSSGQLSLANSNLLAAQGPLRNNNLHAAVDLNSAHIDVSNRNAHFSQNNGNLVAIIDSNGKLCAVTNINAEFPMINGNAKSVQNKTQLALSNNSSTHCAPRNSNSQGSLISDIAQTIPNRTQNTLSSNANISLGAPVIAHAPGIAQISLPNATAQYIQNRTKKLAHGNNDISFNAPSSAFVSSPESNVSKTTLSCKDQASTSVKKAKTFKYERTNEISDQEEKRKITNAKKAHNNREKKKTEVLQLKGSLQAALEELDNLKATFNEERCKHATELTTVKSENKILRDNFKQLLSRSINAGVMSLVSNDNNDYSLVQVVQNP